MQRGIDPQFNVRYNYLERSPEDYKLKKRYMALYDQPIQNRHVPDFPTLHQTFNTQFSPYRAHPSKELSPKNRKAISKNEQPILIRQYENTQKKLMAYQNQNQLIKQKLLAQEVQSLRRQIIRRQEDHARAIDQARQQIKVLLMKNMMLERDIAETKVKQQIISSSQREQLIRQFSILLQQRDAQLFRNDQQSFIEKQLIKKIKEMKIKMDRDRGVVVNQHQSLKEVWRWLKGLGYSFSYLQNWVKIIADHYVLQGTNIEQLTASIQALLP